MSLIGTMPLMGGAGGYSAGTSGGSASEQPFIAPAVLPSVNTLTEQATGNAKPAGLCGVSPSKDTVSVNRNTATPSGTRSGVAVSDDKLGTLLTLGGAIMAMLAL